MLAPAPGLLTLLTEDRGVLSAAAALAPPLPPAPPLAPSAPRAKVLGRLWWGSSSAPAGLLAVLPAPPAALTLAVEATE